MDDLLHTRVGPTGLHNATSRGATAPVDADGFLSMFAPAQGVPKPSDAHAHDRLTEDDADPSLAMAATSDQPADPARQTGHTHGRSTVFEVLAGPGGGSPKPAHTDPGAMDTLPWASPASARPAGPLLHGAAVAEAGGPPILPGPDAGRPGSAIPSHLTAADIAKPAVLSAASPSAGPAGRFGATSMSELASHVTGPGRSPSAAGTLDLAAMGVRATMHPSSGKFTTTPLIDPATSLPVLAGAPNGPASSQPIVPLPLAAGLAPDLEGAVTSSAPAFSAAAPAPDLARITLAEPLAVVTVPDGLFDPAHDRWQGSEAAGLGHATSASVLPIAERVALPQPTVPISQQIMQALANPARDPDVPLDLALDPPELGRVRLSFAEVNGALTLTISVERPETADLMRRHIALLNEEFARAGLDAPSVSISQGGADERSPSKGAPATTEAASLEVQPEQQAVSHSDHPRSRPPGGLDLRV
jgi:hypothetical protein